MKTGLTKRQKDTVICFNVHEADKSTGKRVQKIQIFFNFVDEIFIPPEWDIPELRDNKVNIKKTYVQNDFLVS